MTLEQEQKLEQLLKNWREERHLAVESQRNGLMGNLCEELSEYYRATNNDEKIDALCDIYVFCANSLKMSVDIIINIMNNVVAINPFNTYIFEMLHKLTYSFNYSDEFKINTTLYSIMRSVAYKTNELGYDFYKCMQETIKEISSRTGHYDKNIHKFVKDKSDEAVKKWYKADYSKCKIKG